MDEQHNNSEVITEEIPTEKVITEFSRRELCEFGSAICRNVIKETPRGQYHGSIYPGNIQITDNNISFKGIESNREWSEEETKFIAPEAFWHADVTETADVYSIGMLLYYGTSGGSIPFMESDEKTAVISRIEGEPFDAPKAAGIRLGKIISKATAFNEADRYPNVKYMKIMLDSLLDTTYADGKIAGVPIFGTDEDKLSDVQKMMLRIIRSSDKLELGTAEAFFEQLETEKTDGDPQTEDDSTAGTEIEKPAEDDREIITNKERIRAYEIEAAIDENLNSRPEYSYRTSAEREKKIAEQAKKRRRRPMLIVSLLAILLVSFAILVNASKGFSIFSKNKIEENIVYVEITPGINVEATVISPDYVPEPPPPTPTPVEVPPEKAAAIVLDPNTLQAIHSEPVEPVVSSYEIFVEDVSWSEAEQRCRERGGHLVNIGSQAEFDHVVALARQSGVPYIWIGCHRVDGELVWCNDESINFWIWDVNEPSFIDSGTGDIEDYIMLWNHNNRWCYNDMDHDPAGSYPADYSGKIAYVCEYGT